MKNIVYILVLSLYWYIPVSYTHLDVYKRQIWDKKQRDNPLEKQAIFPNTHEAIIEDVSYTHLAKSIVDCPVWIPRSAFLNTMRHNKTTTPTMLF